MTVDRRGFVARAASLAAAAAVGTPGAVRALEAPPDHPSRHGSEQPRARGDDPLGVRGDFPIVANHIYLNSAYIAPIPRPVVAAGQAFIQAKAERSITVGEMLAKANEVRGQFARLINAAPAEVGLLMATTEGENVLANTLPMEPGDNIVVDDLHYEGALIVHRQAEKRRGVELRVAKHRDGVVTTDDIATLIDNRTRLVSVSLVSSLNGYRHDALALADVAHAHGAHLHLDAIQALGMFPFDVRATDVDSLCSGTYKWLLGGFGIAPFYMKGTALERTVPDRFGGFAGAGGRRYDYATLPFAEVWQLGAALTYLEKVGVARLEEHALGLSRRLKEGLLKQGYLLFQPVENRTSIVTFRYVRPMADLEQAFSAANIAATIRAGHVRLSVSLFNNTDDVDQLLTVTSRLS